MDSYTKARLAECQTEFERQNVLAFIRLEKKDPSWHYLPKGIDKENQE